MEIEKTTMETATVTISLTELNDLISYVISCKFFYKARIDEPPYDANAYTLHVAEVAQMQEKLEDIKAAIIYV